MWTGHPADFSYAVQASYSMLMGYVPGIPGCWCRLGTKHATWAQGDLEVSLAVDLANPGLVFG